MKLRVFLPAGEPGGAGQPLHWQLFGPRNELQREGTATLGEMPRAQGVEVMLPAERVLFARIRLPKVNAATIRELLPFAVEDRLLSDPAQIHAVPGRTNERGETIVAVVDREWVQRALASLARAGLEPSRAWCESALLAGGRGDWNLVLGPSKGMLVDDEGVSATFDRSGGVPLALRIALEEARGRNDAPVLVRVHSSEGAPLPDLAAWEAETGLRFEPGATWETIARGAPAHDSIDLLRGDLLPRKRRASPVPRAAWVIASTLLVLQVAFTVIDERRLAAERRALEQRREAIFRGAFPEAKVVVDPDLQMSRNLAELRRARGLAHGDDFLVQLSRAAHQDSRVKVIEYGNGRLVAR